MKFAIHRVSATPAALELIDRLTEKHGPVAFFLIDVAEGPAGDFSLEGLEDVHFVTRSPYEAGVAE